MSETKQKTTGLVWIIIIIVIMLFVILGIVFPGWVIWLWIPISLMILIGIIFTFTQFFFEPKKRCPKCNTPVPSLYSKTCASCGLTLITKCPDCGKYLNTYVDGKPIKFCNDCGLQLGVKIEVIENPYVRSDKINFCPNCGVDIEEPNLRFCALCGTKIE